MSSKISVLGAQKSIKQFFILIFLIMVLMLPYFVFASAPLDKLKKIQPDTGYAIATETSMATIIGKIVNAFLGLLGIIFIVLMLYGGYNWMTAGGDEAKMEIAKKTIRSAIVGVIITASSYAIWDFIFMKVI